MYIRRYFASYVCVFLYAVPACISIKIWVGVQRVSLCARAGLCHVCMCMLKGCMSLVTVGVSHISGRQIELSAAARFYSDCDLLFAGPRGWGVKVTS